MDTQQMLLDEVRGLRKEVNEGFQSFGSRLSIVETKLDPLVDDAKFQNRIKILAHVATSAITLGIVGAVRLIWPVHVPPPSILVK